MRERCDRCPTVNLSSRDAARLQGWRFWQGMTHGGAQRRVVLCPACAGTAPEPVEAEWAVECTTCDWAYDDAEPLRSEADAQRAGAYHQCEPEIRVYRAEAVLRHTVHTTQTGAMR